MREWIGNYFTVMSALALILLVGSFLEMIPKSEAEEVLSALAGLIGAAAAIAAGALAWLSATRQERLSRKAVKLHLGRAAWKTGDICRAVQLYEANRSQEAFDKVTRLTGSLAVLDVNLILTLANGLPPLEAELLREVVSRLQNTLSMHDAFRSRAGPHRMSKNDEIARNTLLVARACIGAFASAVVSYDQTLEIAFKDCLFNSSEPEVAVVSVVNDIDHLSNI